MAEALQRNCDAGNLFPDSVKGWDVYRNFTAQPEQDNEDNDVEQ